MTEISENKKAVSSVPLSGFIADRWSPRSFSDKPVSKEATSTLIEAARWAPSAFNEQPWRFIIATKDNQKEYEKMLHCLVPFNQDWAASAPLLIISVASMKFLKNNNPNAHAFHDTGLAVGNLLCQATELGLCAHMMSGIEYDKICTTYSIPEEFRPVAAIAIGYLGDAGSLPESLKEMESAPRNRLPLKDLVFSGKFGTVASVIDIS